MELDCTWLLDEDCGQFSGSIAELGQDAGRYTWNNSMAEAESAWPDMTPEQLQKAKDYFGEFGAWEEEEIAAWTPQEVKALLVQLIAGDIREVEDCCWDNENNCIDWEEYNLQTENGQLSGRLYLGENGRLYYYVGC
jgi:hypothetical protein